MKKKGQLQAVAVKVEPNDFDDEELGMASNIIIEVVDPLSHPNLPIYLGLNQRDKTQPVWVPLFHTRFDDYNGLVESLDGVQQVINCLEDSTNTRFSVVKTRRKSFGCTEFNPNGIKVYWGRDGIPYIILNKKLLDCQHGRYRRPLPNGEKKIARPTVSPDGVVKYKVTKKLGCPAQIVLREILRFPEFKVVENTQWLQKVQSKSLKTAFQSGKELTSHRSFVVNLPKIENHENHVIEPASLKPVTLKVKKKKTTRIQEIIHPKIFEKIRELSFEGITGIKNVKEEISNFVNEELAAEEDLKSLESRRYNPRDQDIRNIVKMVENDLRKEGSSLAEVQCTSIVKDLGNLISNINNEKYLEQLKLHLEHLRTTVKSEGSLDTLLACGTVVEESEEPSSKRVKMNLVEQEVTTYPYPIDDADHETQMLYDDVKGEVTHIYYYE